MGNGLASMLLYIVISHVLWFFGIHGTNTLEAVSRKLFESEILINQDLLAQGLLPTHIFSKTFLDTFVFIGGCGSALCMVLALFWWPARKTTGVWLSFHFRQLFLTSMNSYCLGFPSYSART